MRESDRRSGECLTEWEKRVRVIGEEGDRRSDLHEVGEEGE